MAAVVAACTPISPLSAQESSKEAVFDFFTYEGRDLEGKPELPAGYFRNPILAGFFPDPSICKAGDTYYLINSTFAYYPGLPIFQSKDLVNWTLAGHAIHRPDQLDYKGMGVTRALFAPAIEHHDGTFYVVCTMVDGGGNFVITAKDPAGPWSDPVFLDFPGIDPSLFFDDDGRVWLVHNGDAPDNKPLYEGHRAVWLREFDPKTNTMIGGAKLLINGGVDLEKKPVWIEGPHLLKKDGWYYLNCAEGGTGPDHSQVIFRSKEVTGPFVPWSENPTLTQRDLDAKVPDAVTCTGHADFIEGPDGKWWSVFLACRPFAEGDLYTTGRETFLLPLTWTEDGWPKILPDGERVPLVVPSPAGVSPVKPPHAPLNGDFTWTEEFNKEKVDPLWLQLRAPGETPLWKVDPARGALVLTPSTATLSSDEHLAFLSRRVQHATFTATTSLTAPAAGQAAGLTIFQAERNYYYLAVQKAADGKNEIIVEQANRSAPSVIHRAPAPEGDHLWLRTAADKAVVTLSWSADGEEWQDFTPPAGIEPVSVRAAGGGIHFTGAVVGMHARTNNPQN